MKAKPEPAGVNSMIDQPVLRVHHGLVLGNTYNLTQNIRSRDLLKERAPSP